MSKIMSSWKVLFGFTILFTVVHSQGKLIPTARALSGCNQQFEVIFVVDPTETYNTTEIMAIKSAILNFTQSVVNVNKRVGIVFENTLNQIPLSDDRNFLSSSLTPLAMQGPVASTSGILTALGLFSNQNVLQAVVFLTKTTSLENELIQSSQSARNAGIEIYAVGINDDVPLDALQTIASRGGSIYRTQFPNLPLTMTAIRENVCAYVGIPTPVTLPPPTASQRSDNCDTVFDLILVIDGSQSIGTNNFANLKKDLQSFINSLPISDNGVRVGLVLYSDSVSFSTPLIGDRNTLISTIEGLAYPELGTNTHLGLDESNDLLSTGGRAGIPSTVVVITDGISDDRNATNLSADKLKSSGTIIYSVGIGLLDTEELQSLASSNDHVILTSGFGGLLSALISSSFNACPTTITPTVTSTTIPTSTIPPQACSRVFDLMIVLDSSDSATATGFATMKEAVQDFIATLPISSNGIRVGMTEFGYKAQGFPPLSDRATIKGLIATLPHLGGAVATDKGLQNAVTFLTASSRGLPQEVLVITTGQSQDMNLTSIISDITRNISINIYAIGVDTNVFYMDLETIAGDGSRVYYASSINQLSLRLNDVRQALCSPVTSTPPPTSTSPSPVSESSTPAILPNVLSCKDLIGRGVDTGVIPHPSQCDKYIQCYLNSTGGVLQVYRQCPFGQFWDQTQKKCDYASNVVCPYKTCTSTCDKMSKMDGSCGSYWECINGRPHPKCCPIGFAFVHGFGCKPDFYCRDPCPSTCLSDEPCDKKPVWNNRMNYSIYMGQGSYEEMTCRPSYFDVAGCGCSQEDSMTMKPCLMKLSLNFNDDKQLKNQTNVRLEVKNVNVVSGVARFAGESHMLLMDKNKNDSMSTSQHPRLTISFKYRQTLPVFEKQVLVSTGDCGKGGRMYISFNSSNLYFIVESKYGAATTITFPTRDLQLFSWKEVKFIYDGKTMEGHLMSGNDKQVSRVTAPMTKLLECGVGVGYGGLMPGFQGELDDLSISVC